MVVRLEPNKSLACLNREDLLHPANRRAQLLLHPRKSIYLLLDRRRLCDASHELQGPLAIGTIATTALALLHTMQPASPFIDYPQKLTNAIRIAEVTSDSESRANRNVPKVVRVRARQLGSNSRGGCSRTRRHPLGLR